MLFNIIYFTLTFIVPARHTYQLLTQENESSATSLWSVYWLFYSAILFLKSMIPYLNLQTFEITFLLFSLWLYNDYFKGALYVKQQLTAKFNENGIVQATISWIKQTNAILKIMDEESETKEQQ